MVISFQVAGVWGKKDFRARRILGRLPPRRYLPYAMSSSTVTNL